MSGLGWRVVGTFPSLEPHKLLDKQGWFDVVEKRSPGAHWDCDDKADFREQLTKVSAAPKVLAEHLIPSPFYPLYHIPLDPLKCGRRSYRFCQRLLNMICNCILFLPPRSIKCLTRPLSGKVLRFPPMTDVGMLGRVLIEAGKAISAQSNNMPSKATIDPAHALLPKVDLMNRKLGEVEGLLAAQPIAIAQVCLR